MSVDLRLPVSRGRMAAGDGVPGARGRLGRRLVVAMPLIWLTVFFALPFLFVLKISLAQQDIAVPPYTNLLSWIDSAKLSVQLNFGNYLFLFDDSLYFFAYLGSIKVAAVSSVFCILIGFPIALFVVGKSPGRRVIWLALVILPFWTSSLLRVYAWIGLLQNNGVINELLMHIGIIDRPLVLMQTDFSVYISVIYSYLPFMILPIYSSLEKIDRSLIEAGADLGARPMVNFMTITLPLAFPGVIAGTVLVFVPAVGEFMIPALMGGPDNLMIGRVLWDEFFGNRDWPMASAVAVVMLLVLVLPVMLLRNSNHSTVAD